MTTANTMPTNTPGLSSAFWRMAGWSAPIVFAGLIALSYTPALDWVLHLGSPLLVFGLICALLAISATVVAGSWTLHENEDEGGREPAFWIVISTFIVCLLWLTSFIPINLDRQTHQPTRWHVLMMAWDINAAAAKATDAGAQNHPDNALIMRAAREPTGRHILAAHAFLYPDRPIRNQAHHMGLLASAGLGDRPEYRKTVERGWMRLSEFKALQVFALKNPQLAQANAEAAEAYQDILRM